jgi:ammonia channel protein AmtB
MPLPASFYDDTISIFIEDQVIGLGGSAMFVVFGREDVVEVLLVLVMSNNWDHIGHEFRKIPATFAAAIVCAYDFGLGYDLYQW